MTVGPYDSLEQPPETTPTREGSPAPPSGRPGAAKAILRGAAKRCPRCGTGGLFARPFRVRERCPRCELHLQREEGGFLGATTLNYIVTVGAWVVLLIVWLAVDLPDLNVAGLLIASLGLVGLLPLVLFGRTKTIWAAVDYLAFRSTPDYQDPRWN